MAIQFYNTWQQGAPQITNSTTAGIGVLDGVLVNGYGQVNVSTITRIGSVATVTTATGHGLDTSSICHIANCNETEYNGRFPVTSTADGTHFTYTVSGTPNSPATTGSTITSKRASAGWSKSFTNGSTLATYKANAGNAKYLGVDNSQSGGYLKVRGFETAWGAGPNQGNGTGYFPSDAQLSGGVVWNYNYSSGSNTNWLILASDKIFYYFGHWGSYMSHLCFGEFASYKPGDTYNTILIGNYTNWGNSWGDWGMQEISVASNIGPTRAPTYLCRNVNGVLGGIVPSRGVDSWRNNQGLWTNNGPTSFSYPEGAQHFCQMWIGEGANGVRGYLPGIWFPVFSAVMPYYGIFVPEGPGLLAGKTFYAIPAGGVGGAILFEISQTWS